MTLRNTLGGSIKLGLASFEHVCHVGPPLKWPNALRQELERDVSEMTAAKEADNPNTSTALVLKGEEDSLSRGQRLRREQAGVLLFANQASKLSGMFKLHEVIVEMKT